MENVIAVGTGDVFHRFIAPSLEILELQQLLKVLATVDIKKRASLEYLSEKIEHRVRVSEEPLSELLADLKPKNPIVLLAHDNDLHYQDAKDLINSGYKVMLEKPYVVNQSELGNLKELISQAPNQIFLMEYYLMRKMSPLLLLAGIIKPGSFYIGSEEVFRERETYRDLKEYAGKLEDILGDPVSIKIGILESQGDSGKLDHRGAHVFDIRRGGGMLQDMGIHALIPLFALEKYLGKVDKSFIKGSVRLAESKEFYNLAKSKYNLPDNFIGETYAEIEMATEQKIPITISVGKYIADSPTQKDLVLKGTKGKIDLNMHENFMHIYRGNDLIDRIDLVNTKRNRYYPVIRNGMEYFSGQNPSLSIPSSDIQISSQELILNIIEKSRRDNHIKLYENGEKPSHIFNEQ